MSHLPPYVNEGVSQHGSTYLAPIGETMELL